MTQIAGALISIVLVLVAVFLPVAFLGGVTGKLYQQFAVTIAISMVISGIMALTLSPALAAIILRAHHGEKHGFFRWFDAASSACAPAMSGVRARSRGGRSLSSPSRASSPASCSCSARCRRASCRTRTRVTSSWRSSRRTRRTSRSSPSSPSACRRSCPPIRRCRTWRRSRATA